MTEEIRVNYAALEEMAQHCDQVASRLYDTIQLSHKIAQEMLNDAMIGDTGDAFANALSGAFNSSIANLSMKFLEVARDIRGAVDDMKAADSDASSQF